MFETFTMRARQVVFAARIKAGQRGAPMMDVGDLLLGMLIEDQGMMASVLPSIMTEGQGATSLLPLPAQTPFFPLGAANELLYRIEKLLPQSKPIAQTVEIPLSPDLKRVFDGANDVQSMFQHKEIEPLHLLAAVLTEESSRYVKLLQEVAITKELVLQRLNAP
jgi:hypothetical protein